MVQSALLEKTSSPRPRTSRNEIRNVGNSIDTQLADVEALMRSYASPYSAEKTHAIFGEHLNSGGKRLRARVALSAGRALGVGPKASVGWAAAVELMHNATLIHDDIQDEDKLRRGEPTTWAKHGVAQAINVGDLGLMLPFAAVGALPSPPRVRSALSALLAHHGIRTAQGQTLTLGDLDSTELSVEGYEKRTVLVTGSFFSLPVEGTAVMAGSRTEEAKRLGNCFAILGTLFQIQDDIIDLYGLKGREAPGGDIRDGKVSALVVKHLKLSPGDRNWLLAILRRPRTDTSTEDIEAVKAVFLKSGAVSSCLEWIDELATKSLASPPLISHPAMRAMAEDFIRVVQEHLAVLR